jgi:hypothetical protein
MGKDLLDLGSIFLKKINGIGSQGLGSWVYGVGSLWAVESGMKDRNFIKRKGIIGSNLCPTL